MTVFNTEAAEQGVWFPFFNARLNFTNGEFTYDKPEEGAAEFRIRSTTAFWEERNKGRTKEFKMVVNPTTRGMERVSYYPDLSPEEETKEKEDAWDYAITGIKGAKWENGTAIECTRENKLRLLKIPTVLWFFNRVFQLLSDAGVKADEVQEKNALSG